MKEALLQYIWQYQYFNSRDLRVTTGEKVQVLSPGLLNVHQGPDFLDAKIKIGDTCWFGAVELHVVASDWDRHAHQTDKNYRNVILHVVWTNDAVERNMPTLVLENRVPKWLLDKYRQWMRDRSFVACQGQLTDVTEDVWRNWKAKLLEARLRRKASSVGAMLACNHWHWEETCWWLMARAFGGTVNGTAFEMIARSLSAALLARQRNAEGRVEALLLGQAGLLEGVLKDDHPRWLQQEFRHLRLKHRLETIPVPVHFLRMRPAGFPTIRLAQLARLVGACSSWFSRLIEAREPGELRGLMEVTAGPYWEEHYIPDRPAARRVKRLGKSLQDSLFINAFIPLLYAYGNTRNEPAHHDKANRWLRVLGPEKNAVTAGWARVGVNNRHAGDSQALLELRREYCVPRHCLQCAVGKALLGSGR
ncbi:DUF2851 family protein [Flavitalea sp. BT771]|uniref:DUF2851 family protein n=1 Tax=Flavitalea sp. BT771 TaxID=3063329 RepID=UPI0026E350F3|nr:DUF2851 family protein [Flavitalea sp. BT771]MDO6434488.1 DUF2851 family protein [Flavitalea sp. BT771]MDV6223388.1 DUF2851 family protein [Flavitalea sp. BT771]